VKRIAIVDRNPEIYRSGLQDRFPEIEFKSFDMNRIAGKSCRPDG
jgi:hypothetical protein